MTTPQNTISRKAQVRSVLGLGSFLLLIGLYVLPFTLPDVIRNWGGPTSMTMAEAVTDVTDGITYAKIEDGVWVCDSISYQRTYSSSTRRWTVSGTHAFQTDSDGEIAIWVRLSGEMTCDELQSRTPEGYLEPLEQSTRMDLAGDGKMRYVATANTFFEMCGYCGTTNSLIGSVAGVICIILGVGLFVFWWKTMRGEPMPEDADTDLNTNQEINPT